MDNSLTKPKRALLAYCALADRLHESKATLVQTLTPFFAPVCREFAGKLFDAAQFATTVAERYDLRIPRLAVLGLAEQLAGAGLLVSLGGKSSKPVYQYAAAPPSELEDVHPVTEVEVDQVLAEFAVRCRQDLVLTNETDQALHEAFLDRLLHTDSMRLLSRREGSATTKSDAKTLTRSAPSITPAEQQQLRLDFHVAQYLIDLQSSQPVLFNRVSDIAFANMAAEALACFSESTADERDLNGLTVYLDSPLLLDVLGINVDYAEYGMELLQMIQASGATPAVFDDCITEAESVVAAQLAAQRTGIAVRSNQWGTSAKPHLLGAIANNVGARAEAKGLQIRRDPQLDLLRRARETVGDIQAEMSKRMSAWSNDDARKHDERSVWSMLRVRDCNDPSTKIRDCKELFIARNTALVRIANDAWRKWLRGGGRLSQNLVDRCAPVAMSDKQLAGYLWLRRGSGNGRMSKARLLAHCSAAIRPRPDVKAKAYNLVLELHGKEEAEHIAALLEDREGERALMRATHADPEDVTKERLPYIIQQVKLAAGEFAAASVRAESQAELEAIKQTHNEELQQLQTAAAEEKALAQRETRAVEDSLMQERFERERLEAQLSSLAKQVAAAERGRKQREVDQLGQAFTVALKAYGRFRWELVALFAACSLWLTTAATDWEPLYQLGCSFFLSGIGFWFVPEYLEGLVVWYSRSQLRVAAARAGVQTCIPDDVPNFKTATWDGLNALQARVSE